MGKVVDYASKLKPYLTLTTPKVLVFKEWRVGLFHKLLYLLVLFYVLWDLLRNQLFLEHHTPINVPSMFASDYQLSFTNAQNQFYNLYNSTTNFNTAFRYCNTNEYDFWYSAEFKYEDIKCYFASGREISTKLPPRSMFFTTLEQRSRTVYVQMSGPEGGQAGVPCVRGIFGNFNLTCANNGEVQFRNGHCECTSSESHFNVAAEYMTFNMEHRYDAVPEQGAMPKTVFRVEGSDTDLLTFGVGEPARITVYDLLRMANINLDSAFSFDPTLASTGGPTAGTFPRQRVTGATLTLKMSYYNYNQAPGREHKRNGKAGDVLCVVEIQPNPTWTSMGDNVDHTYASSGGQQYGDVYNVYRYGVLINVEATGSISEVSVSAVVLALIQGLVLLGFVDTLCMYINFYALGARSRLYSNFGRQSVSYYREYARYALRTLVIGKVFQALDRDNSGFLDEREMYQILKESPCCANMEEETVLLLASLLLQELDKQKANTAKVTKDFSKVGNGKITPLEFTDIFSEDTSSATGLRLVMKDMTDFDKAELLRYIRARGTVTDGTELKKMPSHKQQ